ncbi:MAG: orotate phosphoribosyltransferase [Bacteroidetes bacterium]|nr:orotate phosphoribosyltransferase [Bacteroidota bacterium]
MSIFSELELQTAQYLLQIKAIKLNAQNPFTWASGLRSPIYCDNRRILSFPEVRDFVSEGISKLALKYFAEAEVIAGVATGGIAHGVLVAKILNKPFVYVRSSAKGHGLQNLVEGYLEPGKRVLVIEDLVSTGGSSLEAVKALRENKSEILGMIAVFTYGLQAATDNFEKANCTLFTLSNYKALIHQAKYLGMINDEDEKALNNWSENPQEWSERYINK